jgi:hypothetical protein
MKNLFLVALLGIAPHVMANPMHGFQMPGLCDLVARDLMLSIVDAQTRNVPVEHTDRYQQMRSNINYQSVNIPRLLAKSKDLEVTGAGYRDMLSHARIECNKASRGAQ